jgi:hypothetical protein
MLLLQVQLKDCIYSPAQNNLHDLKLAIRRAVGHIIKEACKPSNYNCRGEIESGGR